MMTLLRKAEHEALKNITLSGRVLDLGGDKRSEYQKLFKGNFSLVTANLNEAAQPDIRCDFEKPLPIESGAYDGILLINLLEHIFEYRQLLEESARVVRPGGTVVVVVPYLFPYHPSPDDFHRYSATALKKALAAAGFYDIRVEPLGSGVFAVRWLLIERLLPFFLQPLSLLANPISRLLDILFVRLARILGKAYQPSDYALGFVATARKS